MIVLTTNWSETFKTGMNYLSASFGAFICFPKA